MKSKMNVKSLLILVLAMSFIFGLSSNADAQRKRTRTKTPTPKLNINAAELKKGAEDVGIQLKNVTKFVFLLGGIASGIEQIDKDIKAGKASRDVANQNAEFKQNVINSIRALRAGLVKLEVDFRTKPALKPYLPKIEGIIGQSARAEDLALAGQFTDAGQELLVVVETLTDTLVAMP